MRIWKSRLETVDCGPWTVDRGPWAVDRGLWTVDRGSVAYGMSKCGTRKCRMWECGM